MQSQAYLLRICLEIGRGFSRLREVEGGWVGLSRVITEGAQLNGLVGWQGPQPVPTSATQLGTLLMNDVTMNQALIFASGLKLGHYMKIPPRAMFSAQIIGSIVALTAQLSVQAWMFEHIHDMCLSSQDNGFICLSTTVFGTASIMWGVIS